MADQHHGPDDLKRRTCAVTFYEHAMLGTTLALTAGLHRRHGWRICAMAAVAAALPDWDGLSLVFGGSTFAQVHRVWGHNVIAAVVAGMATGGLGYWCSLSTRVQRAALSLWAHLAQSSSRSITREAAFSSHALTVWLTAGILASLSHLPADMVYSGRPSSPAWPVPLLWPWSEKAWAWPLVPWGDLVTTLIFIGEMFTLYRWLARAQLLACVTLVLVMSYLLLRYVLMWA